MTNEDKQLLLKDLCARLPYSIIAYNSFNNFDVEITGILGVESADISCTYISVKEYIDSEDNIECIKPYLRPMSSMTEKELSYYNNHLITPGITILEEDLSEYLDWMHSHHLDYRGLIEKGLALEAPEGMYKTE